MVSCKKCNRMKMIFKGGQNNIPEDEILCKCTKSDSMHYLTDLHSCPNFLGLSNNILFSSGEEK